MSCSISLGDAAGSWGADSLVQIGKQPIDGKPAHFQATTGVLRTFRKTDDILDCVGIRRQPRDGLPPAAWHGRIEKMQSGHVARTVVSRPSAEMDGPQKLLVAGWHSALNAVKLLEDLPLQRRSSGTAS